MPNDGCRVGQVFDLRARIEDEGNWATGLKLSPVAAGRTGQRARLRPRRHQPAAGGGHRRRPASATPSIRCLCPPPCRPSNQRRSWRCGWCRSHPPATRDFTPDPSIPADPALAGSAGRAAIRSARRRCAWPQTLTVVTGYYTAPGPGAGHLGARAHHGAAGASAAGSTPRPTRSPTAGPASPSSPPTGWATPACRTRCGSTSIGAASRTPARMCPAPPACRRPAARLHRPL